MKKAKLSVVSVMLAIIMAVSPMTMAANTGNEPSTRVEDGVVYMPLRHTAYSFGATVEWDGDSRAAIITGRDGRTHTIVIEAAGGFIEDGVSWVPAQFVENVLAALLHTEERIPRIDLTLWEPKRFADVREAAFSTDLPHGVVAVNYIEYISSNLGARSAFTYRELETAVWIVEELLAMGHDWDNIAIQEFTYWDILDLDISLDLGIDIDMFPLNWDFVTSPGILGVNREYQLRPDRVSQNIVLTIPGQSERKIIVGAHYDSPPYSAASDNASGTALLLESAQRMLEMDNYYTIVYVFFGAEEVGFIGALYYVEMLTQSQHHNIVMMINADGLIDGPYLIYGAGAAPAIDNELIAQLSLAILESQMDMIVMQYQIMMAEFEAAGIDPRLVLPFYTLEGFLEFVLYDIASTPPALLFKQTTMLGLMEPVVDDIARQVSGIAAELTGTHSFELISMPETAGMVSDNLAFLFAGHRVVNLAGMERIENISDELAAKMLLNSHIMNASGGDLSFGDFTFTVVHTPSDEFHTIEYLWPGMMNANLKAFGLFLEAVLSGNFS